MKNHLHMLAILLITALCPFATASPPDWRPDVVTPEQWSNMHYKTFLKNTHKLAIKGLKGEFSYIKDYRATKGACMGYVCAHARHAFNNTIDTFNEHMSFFADKRNKLSDDPESVKKRVLWATDLWQDQLHQTCHTARQSPEHDAPRDHLAMTQLLPVTSTHEGLVMFLDELRENMPDRTAYFMIRTMKHAIGVSLRDGQYYLGEQEYVVEIPLNYKDLAEQLFKILYHKAQPEPVYDTEETEKEKIAREKKEKEKDDKTKNYKHAEKLTVPLADETPIIVFAIQVIAPADTPEEVMDILEWELAQTRSEILKTHPMPQDRKDALGLNSLHMAIITNNFPVAYDLLDEYPDMVNSRVRTHEFDNEVKEMEKERDEDSKDYYEKTEEAQELARTISAQLNELEKELISNQGFLGATEGDENFLKQAIDYVHGEAEALLDYGKLPHHVLLEAYQVPFHAKRRDAHYKLLDIKSDIEKKTDNPDVISDALKAFEPLPQKIWELRKQIDDAKKLQDNFHVSSRALHWLSFGSNTGITPLALAVSYGNADMMKLLIQHKADINAVSVMNNPRDAARDEYTNMSAYKWIDGNTAKGEKIELNFISMVGDPLSNALLDNNRLDLAEILLANGADTSAAWLWATLLNRPQALALIETYRDGGVPSSSTELIVRDKKIEKGPRKERH